MITENSVTQETVIYCLGCGQESPARAINKRKQLKKYCSSRCGSFAAHHLSLRGFASLESIYRKEYALKRRHGIAFADYDAMLKSQKGKCALCPMKDQNRSLMVDHDHETNRNRGLLCRICNLKLGYLEQNIQWPAKAMSYLYHYKSFPGPARPSQKRRKVGDPYKANVGDTNVGPERVLGHPGASGSHSRRHP